MPRGGRGGRGGRGAGRGGRGGRRGGRGGGRFNANAAGAQAADVDNDNQNCDQSVDIFENVAPYFMGVTSFDQHLAAQEAAKSRYVAGVAVLHRNNVEISQNAKVRALSAAWARSDYELAQSLLHLRSSFTVAEVLKAVSMLDSARKIREWEKKLAKREASGSKVKRSYISKVKYNKDNLEAVRPSRGSASGAFCRHLRRWVRQFTREELEFFALHLSKDPWKKLADICHFNPTKDFPNLPWFLPFCFGADAPEGSLVSRNSDITAENVNEQVAAGALPYSAARQFLQHLTDESKALIVSNDDKVDRGIWWYEELKCAAVDEAIEGRLRSGEQVTLSYGKLMERLLLISNMNPKPGFFDLLLPVAEQKLKDTTLNLEAPVVVIGDASSSMSVAIRTATIISSLLTAIMKSELIFFNNRYWKPDSNPRTIADVLKMARETSASGCTAHAAALWPYYAEKQVVKTFIVVTDEEENTSYQNHRFFPLFELYRQEVYQANLVFISFLRSQHAEGQMVSEAKRRNLPVQQFVLQGSRPDLNKLDTILGKLGVESMGFNQEVVEMTERIEREGMDEVFKQIFKECSATED